MRMPDERQKDSHAQGQMPIESEQKRNDGGSATTNSQVMADGTKETAAGAQAAIMMNHHRRENAHHPQSSAPGSMSSTSDDNVSDKALPAAAAGDNTFSSSNPQPPAGGAAAAGDSGDSFIADWKRYYDSSAQQLQETRQETLMTVYENMTHSSTPHGNEQQQQQQPQPPPPSQQPQQPSQQQHHHHEQQPQQRQRQRQQQTNMPDLMPINLGLAHGSSELMNVYDNLTREGIAPPTEATALRGGQQQQQIDSWSYGAGNIPIPPAPDVAIGSLATVATDGGDAASSANGSAGKRRGGGRSLRKRNSSTASLNNNDETGSITSGGSVTQPKQQRRSSKSRRKTKGEKEGADGRWSKRFTWPEELHRDFVSAIFDVGLKHSSPSAILECMPKHEQITSERVKSHLQKYRLHRHKSKQEFMTSYEESVKRMQKDGMGKIQSLSAGGVPAHLTFATLTGQEVVPAPAVPEAEKGAGAERGDASNATQHGSSASVTEGTASNRAANELQGYLMLPRLTDDEKKSPIGASMGYLMGLFFSLKQQLMAQRVAKAKQTVAVPAVAVSGGVKQNQPVTAVFDSFVSGNPPTGPAKQVQAQSKPAYNIDKNMPVRPPPSATSRGSLSSPVVATSAANPSARSNLEESNMMKREMQNQMALQNKMRALKQQEVNKYRRAGSGEEEQQNQQQQPQPPPQQQGESQPRQAVVFADETGSGHDAGAAAKTVEYSEQEFQGAGETAAMDSNNNNRGGNRLRDISIGADDFWNTDVMDEQLFEFLMNN